LLRAKYNNHQATTSEADKESRSRILHLILLPSLHSTLSLSPAQIKHRIQISMFSEYTVFRGAEGAIKPAYVQKPQLGPKEILIKITHSGVCATDLAYVQYGIA
jgi:Zn-dependent alcohol dehydrogenase